MGTSGGAAGGFADADNDEGWARLIALSKVPVRVGRPPSAKHLAALDAWENRWFPIIDVVLRTHHEPVHEIVFRNLRQTEGLEVMVSVKTLLDRLEIIARPKKKGGLGEPGQRAREHLLRRGLTDEVLAEARTLLARVHARLRKVSSQWWTLEMPTHTGRWDKTGLRAPRSRSSSSSSPGP